MRHIIKLSEVKTKKRNLKAAREKQLVTYKRDSRDFPGGAVVKNLPANAGDMGSSPGLGRSHVPQRN